MEANSPKEFLEKILPTRFRSDKAEGIDIIAQVNLTGSDGGKWIVTIKNQQLNVTEGTYRSPTLILTMTDSDFVDVVNGKLSVEKAFFTGRINFKGSIALALKLRDAGFL